MHGFNLIFESLLNNKPQIIIYTEYYFNDMYCDLITNAITAVMN